MKRFSFILWIHGIPCEIMKKGCQFNHDNRNKISRFYINARSIRNKFVELKSYVSLEKPDIIFKTETWVKISVQNNKFSKMASF